HTPHHCSQTHSSQAKHTHTQTHTDTYTHTHTHTYRIFTSGVYLNHYRKVLSVTTAHVDNGLWRQTPEEGKRQEESEWKKVCVCVRVCVCVCMCMCVCVCVCVCV